jgi:protein O-mannosyl-transferase
VLCRRLSLVGRGAVVVLLGCELAFFGYTTRQQIAMWHDDERLWSAALTYFPNSVMTNWQMSLALVAQGRYGEALPLAERAVRMSPDFARARASLGYIDVKLGRYAAAVTELEAALRLKPGQSSARFDLACAYCRLGQLDKAWAVVEQLLVENPLAAEAVSREGELEALRTDARYAERLRTLVVTAQQKKL